VIGHIELNEIDRANGSARVCRVLVGEAEQRGRGVGQAMLRQILALAFGDLGLHRVDLGVFDFNLAAIACYEKVGFAHEGRFRDARRMPGGRYWSVLQMSILEDEWRRNSAARA
jgi:RimJ/RimL family protein N-acetyltransferase